MIDALLEAARLKHLDRAVRGNKHQPGANHQIAELLWSHQILSADRVAEVGDVKALEPPLAGEIDLGTPSLAAKALH